MIGKAVVVTDGKVGTVQNLWLDELHGLRISIKGHDGRWPVDHSQGLRVTQIARSFQSIPIKMKSPTSVSETSSAEATTDDFAWTETTNNITWAVRDPGADALGAQMMITQQCKRT